MQKPPPKPGLLLRKLSHGGSPETALKILWRETLSESEKAYWREQFTSTRPQRVLRDELRNKYGIDLTQDTSLTRFRKWVPKQDALDEEAQEAHADEIELVAQGLSGEPLREALLERMKRRAYRKGDFTLGAVAVRLDLQAGALTLNQEKFKEKQRTKLDAGLAELANHIKRNPKARAAYEALKAETKSAKR